MGGPAPVHSKFWKEKEAEENRVLQEGTFEGTISSYNFRQGWGYILADSVDSLPEVVKARLEEAKAEAVSNGKTMKDDGLLYFRRPDVVEGYKPAKEEAVTFSVYIDDKGAGACEVQGTWDEEAEEEEQEDVDAEADV